MMENDSCSNSHIQTCSFLSILWNIHKKIAHFSMNRQQPGSFIPQEKCSTPSKRMILNRFTPLPNLHSTHPNPPLFKILPTLLQRLIGLILNFLISSLIPKHLELLQYLHLLTIRPTRHKQHLLNPKSTSTSDDIPHIILLTDVMQQQISLW